MKNQAIWATLCIVLMVGGCSGDKKSETKKDPVEEAENEIKLPPAEHLANIQERFETEYGAPKPRNETAQQRRVRQELTKEAMQIAEDNPEDPVAPKALAWIMEVNNTNRYTTEAIELVKQRYLDSPDIAPFVTNRLGTESLEYLADNSPNDAIKAQALFFLASMARMGDDEQSLDRAEALYQRIVDEFPDASSGGMNFGEMAAANLEAIQTQKQLQVGKVVPDIVGTDTDGVEFKLSDYRGKVVMLDFWGNW